MEVALASFHYDTGVAGWSSMSRDEKYSLFEAVTFQALGRRIDAKLMDEEISAGPYANQWNSGIIHSRNSGQMDMSSWQLVCGHPESSALCRLRSKVFTYKAGEENDALFATDVMMNNQPDEKRTLTRSYVNLIYSVLLHQFVFSLLVDMHGYLRAIMLKSCIVKVIT